MNNETNYCREKKSCQKSDCKDCLLRGIEEPKLGEECGVFGIATVKIAIDAAKEDALAAGREAIDRKSVV